LVLGEDLEPSFDLLAVIDAGPWLVILILVGFEDVIEGKSNACYSPELFVGRTKSLRRDGERREKSE
jgi:hypothetical protein